jgi:hypothetical protein
MRKRSAEWLAYFRGNVDRAPPPVDAEGAAGIAPGLRAALVRSLGRFYLGETGEGRIAHEAARSGDPALDEAMCESIVLYIREEGRHARALAGALVALGAALPERHYTEVIFRRARRLMGLRTKMMTLAVAEIVGLAYYELLAERVPPVAGVARTLARDEREHLAFQAEFFARVIEGHAEGERGVMVRVRGGMIAAGYAAIVACAVATLALDHAPLLRELRVTPAELAARCAQQAWSGIDVCRALLREPRLVASAAGDRASPSVRPVRYGRAEVHAT